MGVFLSLVVVIVNEVLDVVMRANILDILMINHNELVIIHDLIFNLGYCLSGPGFSKVG